MEDFERVVGIRRLGSVYRDVAYGRLISSRSLLKRKERQYLGKNMVG